MALDPKTPLTVHMLLLNDAKTHLFVRAYLGPVPGAPKAPNSQSLLLEKWLIKPDGNMLLSAEGRGWAKLLVITSMLFGADGGPRSGTPQTLLLEDIPTEGLALLQKVFQL